ncbi:S-adenosylmethionine-dependent methyltransferase [Penicillium argentinense]|uniref:Protein-lysine N-methyltransferase EFM4 n=1 Tax=Penicillium argentinense TaxID=1131581 RepID=A0A9W9FP12_9EURO|nr:S-adenosylmethionine-dependent methyltransferase [Penicillium argentinense]KAJ5103806.1 S-adenosylmethionine-dependent methyltransferase [Penicillium argentinense]
MAEETRPSYLSPNGAPDAASKSDAAPRYPSSGFTGFCNGFPDPFTWETYYARTLAHIANPANHEQTAPKEDDEAGSDAESDINDEDDPGTSWFSEHNAPEKVLHFLTQSSFPLSPRNTRTSRIQPSVLDLGTGNGSMLALLRKRGGFSGDLVGVDYSAQSVGLARELQRTKGHSAYHSDSEDEDSEDEGEEQSHAQTPTEPGDIHFEEWDILGSTALLSSDGKPVSASANDETLSWFPYSRGGFDIVLDKGTFDAISLAEDAKETRVCERYPDIVRRLIRAGGFLIVTSCNWTEEELMHWFTGAGAETGSSDRFNVWGRVEYPRFRFGGQEGQGVCTVCFQRVLS